MRVMRIPSPANDGSSSPPGRRRTTMKRGSSAPVVSVGPAQPASTQRPELSGRAARNPDPARGCTWSCTVIGSAPVDTSEKCACPNDPGNTCPTRMLRRSGAAAAPSTDASDGTTATPAVTERRIQISSRCVRGQACPRERKCDERHDQGTRSHRRASPSRHASRCDPVRTTICRRSGPTRPLPVRIGAVHVQEPGVAGVRCDDADAIRRRHSHEPTGR
jgi:hypothetical protein